MDDENWLLTGIPPGTSSEELISNLTNDASKLKIFADAQREYDGEAVATGMMVKLFVDGVLTDERKLCVLGDVDGEGEVDISDILYMRADIINTYTLSKYQFFSSDLNADDEVNINDILYLRSHILGTYTIGRK